MGLTQYQIDAFATRAFEGNPAAICPLENWLDDALMQAIAEENNLSETAFFVPLDDGFHLRWFTPAREVDLCGHATLAAAHVIFDILGYARDRIRFHTRSGDLFVSKTGDAKTASGLAMDLPATRIVRRDIEPQFAAALGASPLELWSGEDFLAVFESETAIRRLKPNALLLRELDLRGVIVTAPGIDFDFVSRFFAPKFGIEEDPVTGSAYWARRLNKNTLRARQISKRGGDIHCEVKGERVTLIGAAVTFMTAELNI